MFEKHLFGRVYRPNPRRMEINNFFCSPDVQGKCDSHARFDTIPLDLDTTQRSLVHIHTLVNIVTFLISKPI